jgi:soluble lytic murein transglycosylase
MLILGAAAGYSAERGAPRDEAFLAAHAAFLKGDRAGLDRQAEKVRGHVLEPYVEFWRLRLRLDEADPLEMKDFLVRNAGTVLAEQLRRDWLRVLGRGGQWALFLEEHPALVRDDPEVACYALHARWLLQDASVFADLKTFWNEPKALPEGCAPVAEAMLASGELQPRDVRNRIRILIQAGFLAEAGRLSEKMPADQFPRAGRIRSAAGEPAAFLERSDAESKTAAGRELALFALARMAENDPRKAAEYWERGIRERFSPEDRQYGWSVLAVPGARRHLPEAVEWFRQAGETPLSDGHLAWRARAALRQENWRELQGAIVRMSPEAKNEPTWIYWLGRSLLALGAREEAEALLVWIAGEHHYYGRLAAEELGLPLRIPPRAEPPTREEQEKVSSLAGLQRAVALYRLDLRDEASLEWRWAVRPMSDRLLLAAAELAHRNGIWDGAINTAERTAAEHDFGMRYIAPHREVLSKQAKARQLEESWVLGLVRQESRFVRDIRSSAGAVGLMQLMPATARWVAGKIGMRDYRPSRLSLPQVNAALGAFYLSHVLGELGGSPVLATAAYNAGPARARRWRDARPLEGAIYVETIPFTETRQYVKKVMVNAVYYAALSGGEGTSLKARLGTVGGAVSAAGGTDP